MDKKLLKELNKRVNKKQFRLEDFCFSKQLAFIKDPARFKAALCSTRAGKTVGMAADIIDTCLENKNIIVLYLTSTARAARSIIWGDLKKIIQDYDLDVKIDETRLTIKFNKTGSEARLGGAKDETEIERYRGWKLKKVWVDEAQLFRPYLKYFIEDILTVRLRDLRGQIVVAGTPGPICAGTFYDITHSENWSQHHWTAFDNPHMKDLEKTLEEERKVRGITEEEPGYIRETFGRWVDDHEALVFKFDRLKNVYEQLPTEKLEYVLGIDIGFHDSDSISVVGFSYTSKNVYLVEEIIKEKQDITSLIQQIKKLQAQYSPVKMVMDSGGLGRKIVEELQQRHLLHILPAEKQRKLEFIELLNDDLRTGKLKAFKGSRFEQDCALIQWDRSDRMVAAQKLKISDSYHSDAADSLLYSWRECQHYLSEAPKRNPTYLSDEWAAAEEQRLMAEFEKAQREDSSIMGSQEDMDSIFREDS